ncbi:hypothetical protein BHE74_00028289 [Ensete ventricosum]|uniref:Uncharacterized protein n=1 Tax=Ensete ventricosum TaxID=4639 RepID=A0A426ZR49_ENSVE|nr:hypothetical protein B296_00029989 [Ensete ventricosum]RWW03550.1 hypothetical protein GW17_00033289 [Ensete ventricosum]RWW64480.1 hypothetical protein BHE74_00028289 [Ensete ventricosum]
MAIPFPVLSAKKVILIFLNISFLAVVLFYVSIHLDTSHAIPQGSTKLHLRDSSKGCDDLCKAKSVLLNSEAQFSQGYINYLHIFYCVCGKYPILGYALLILWLLVLFYLLADTSANYFCANLEGLSTLLKLPPTIAGVTLLSLGNGAPDAVSSIVSFMGAGSGVVGLNSILGGSFFVSCVVVGIISTCVSSHENPIDKSSFVRDLLFFLFVLSVLFVILVIGKINIWGAIAFTSLYLVYVFLVAVGHFCRKEEQEQELLPCKTRQKNADLEAPLLEGLEDHEPDSTEKETASRSESDGTRSNPSSACYYCKRIVQCLELPLSLPRRLTIPDVSKEKWSKPSAVASVTLAPLLLAVLVNSKRKDVGSEESLLLTYISGGLAGLVLGIVSLVETEKEGPPTRFLFPWLAGGFLMSVTWTYIIAQELVSLLLSLGTVMEISTSILGLTVLAWGNSVGDLIASLAVALHDRQDGTQVAMSGCYGGPIFNTLVGLGLSFVFSSWSAYPTHVVVIPRDPTLYQTMGFLVGGLLWALVMLPRRGMRLDRVLGSGLLSIYLCSLSLRIVHSLGLL